MSGAKPDFHWFIANSSEMGDIYLTISKYLTRSTKKYLDYIHSRIGNKENGYNLY